MFANTVKIFVLLAVVAVSNLQMTCIAFCAEEPTAETPEAKMKKLIATLDEKSQATGIARMEVDEAEKKVSARDAELQIAETLLKDAEAECVVRESLLDNANKALKAKPDDKDLKSAVVAADSAAGTAALAARNARAERDEKQKSLDTAKAELKQRKTAAEVANQAVDKAKSDIEKATAELVKTEKPAETAPAANKKPTEQTTTQPAPQAAPAASAPIAPAADAKAAEDAKAAAEKAQAVAEGAATAAQTAAKEAQTANENANAAATEAGKAAKETAKNLRKDAKPAKPVDAFVLLPLVTTIEQAENIADFCPCGKRGRCPCPVKKYDYDYRFDAAAQFPLAGFGLRGERGEREGAIIYEGMRFAIREDGRYELRFVVETPGMPVTMRLQLILEDESTQNRYTLTLPPISIPAADKPQYSSQQREIPPVYSNLQTVHHEGYLPFLAQSRSNIRVVRRTGSARFGFGVDVP